MASSKLNTMEENTILKDKKKVYKQGEKKPKSNKSKPHVSNVNTPIGAVMKGEAFEGAGNLHGYNFQTKIICFYLCQTRAQKLKNVRLATEVKAADKFDDLVLCYEKEGVMDPVYCFFQAKEILLELTPNELKTNPSFSLKVYFESYVKILNQISQTSIEYLIMFTTADFNYNLFNVLDSSNKNGNKKDEKKITLKKLDNSTSPLVPQKSYQFVEIPVTMSEAIFGSVEDKQLLQTYLEKLIFAVGQPDYNNIDNSIKPILSQMFNRVKCEDLADKIFGKMFNIYSQRKGREISPDFVHFFDDFCKEINRTFLNGVSFSKWDDRLAFKGFFKDTKLIVEFLSGSNFQLHYISTDTPALTCLKVAQALLSIYESCSYPELYFAVVDLPTLLKNNERVQHALDSKNEFVLVIKWDEQDMVLKVQLNSLLMRLNKNPKDKEPKQLKIVFVGNSKLVAKKFGLPMKDQVRTFEDRCCYNDVTEEEQSRLMATEINFQGSRVTMADLIDKPDLGIMKFNINFIDKVTEVKDLIIGQSLEDLWPMDPFYIKRQFKVNVRFCKESLKHLPDTELLVLIGADQSILESQIGAKKMILFKDCPIDKISDWDIIILLDADRSEDNFKSICKACPLKNIHCFRKTEDTFVLLESVQNRELAEEYVIANTARIKIITGEPGIGKSVVLTSILHAMKWEQSSSWVIRINLLDVCSDLAKLKSKDRLDTESILDLLCKVEKLNNNYEKELLRFYLTNTDRSILFFDGFDEICPNHEEKVLQMLKLLETTRARIWVTTRPNLQKKLEDELSLFTYSLVAFSYDDQKTYLEDVWSTALGVSIDDDVIADFTLRVLENFTLSRIKSIEQFTGIPLQTQMISVIFQDDCQKFYESPTIELKIEAAVDVLELYDKFVTRKYEVFFETKERLEIYNPNNDMMITELKQRFTKQHKQLAIQLLFSENFEALVAAEVFTTSEELKLVNVGLVLSKNEQLSFLHRTYAEYFVAMHLTEILKAEQQENSSRYQAVINFLQGQYFLQANSMIRIFLDYELAKSSEILKAVIGDDLLGLVQILENDDTRSIDKPDILNRTPWLMAAAYSKYWNLDMRNRLFDHSQYYVIFRNEMISSILELLWNQKNNLEVSRVDVLGFNVLCHAIGSFDPNNNAMLYLARILSPQKNREDMVFDALDMAFLLDRDPPTMNRFLMSFLSLKDPPLKFWKSKRFHEFFRKNAKNFPKMATVLRIASPEFTADLYNMDFLHHAMDTGNYFVELLTDRTIDLRKLKKAKYLGSVEFIYWCRRCVERHDFVSLDAMQKKLHITVAEMRLEGLDLYTMFQEAVKTMNNNWVLQLIGCINNDWRCVDYLSYFKALFDHRRFVDFSEAVWRISCKDLKYEVLQQVNCVDAFRSAVLDNDFDSLLGLFDVFNTEEEIRRMKDSVDIHQVVECFRSSLLEKMVFKSHPLLSCISSEERERVKKVLTSGKYAITSGKYAKLKLLFKMHSVPIKSRDLPLICRWLECYPSSPPANFHWSIWEHVYCLFCWLDSGIRRQINIEIVLGEDYLTIVLDNMANFQQVAHIFHLATDEQKRNICRAEGYRFLKHAFSSYFDEITDEKCGNGNFLKGMGLELLELPEFIERFGDAVNRYDFAALMKLDGFVMGYKKQLLELWESVNYKDLFRTAFEQLELDFLVHLLGLFNRDSTKDLLATVEISFTGTKSLSREQTKKLDDLFICLSTEQKVKLTDQMKFADEFRTAVCNKDHRKLHDIFDTYQHCYALIGVMKGKVEVKDCIGYCRHFVITRDGEGICGLLQYVSIQEGNHNPRYSEGFSEITKKSEMQRSLAAAGDKYLQQLQNSLVEYSPDSKLTIWQHLYDLFGRLWYFYKQVTREIHLPSQVLIPKRPAPAEIMKLNKVRQHDNLPIRGRRSIRLIRRQNR